MPKLSSHSARSLVKLLALGEPKSGKTGSLISLVQAGYKLRILDFDNLLDILVNKILEICPDRIDQVEFISMRDRIKVGAGGSMAVPKAWLDSLKLLNEWKDGDINHGAPADWGPDYILVIDSLSRWCDAAYDFHDKIMPRSDKGTFDGRAVYGSAQDDVEKQIAGLTSPQFGTNVIMICHGQYMDLPDGSKKIFPQGVGQKLSPKIPTYFPNYVQYTNHSGKRQISFKSGPMINLASTNPSKMPETLSLETGLAEIFAVLRDQPTKPMEAPKPTRPVSVTLRKVN